MHPNKPPAPDDSIIRQPEASRLTGFCDMSLRRMEKAGTFPARFKLNPRGGLYGATGWSRREVMDWIAARRASRQAA